MQPQTLCLPFLPSPFDHLKLAHWRDYNQQQYRVGIQSNKTNPHVWLLDCFFRPSSRSDPFSSIHKKNTDSFSTYFISIVYRFRPMWIGIQPPLEFRSFKRLSLVLVLPKALSFAFLSLVECGHYIRERALHPSRPYPGSSSYRWKEFLISSCFLRGSVV